jgi:hypothetical protein
MDDVIVIDYSGGGGGGVLSNNGSVSVATLPTGAVTGAVLVASGGWIPMNTEVASHAYLTSQNEFPIICESSRGANVLRIIDANGVARTFDIEGCTVEIDCEARIKLTPEENYNLAMKIIG